MIPRYQRMLFFALLAGIVLMAIFLFYERQRAHERLTAQGDSTPLAAPVLTDTQPFTLDLANDGDGSVTAAQRQIALPPEPSVKARALLEHLMAEYALPKSGHPLASGAAIDDVFLVKLPIAPRAEIATAIAGSGLPEQSVEGSSAGEIAVVNLRGSFVNDHPSGVQVEMLTIQSMLGTLHANFAEITQVQFLVDGQPRNTLAGHADIARIYPAVDTTAVATSSVPGQGAPGESR